MNTTTITTGESRLSYVHVFEPAVPVGGGDPKYSVTVLLPKNDPSAATIFAAMDAALQAGINSTFSGVMPPNPAKPVYDGDGTRPNGEHFGPECKGCYVFTASSNRRPDIVDANIQPVLDRGAVYSGCYGRVNINFFTYNKAGKRGVGCGLNSVQKLRDGEPLGGRVSAAEAFGGAQAAPPYHTTPIPAYQAAPEQPQYSDPGWYTAPDGLPMAPTMPQYQTTPTPPAYQTSPAQPQGQPPQYGTIPPWNPIPGGVMGA